MPTIRVFVRTRVDEEVCAYVEFKHYDRGTDIGNEKKVLKIMVDLSSRERTKETNVLTEETQKGKDAITGERHLCQHSSAITGENENTSGRSALTS